MKTRRTTDEQLHTENDIADTGTRRIVKIRWVKNVFDPHIAIETEADARLGFWKIAHQFMADNHWVASIELAEDL